MLRAELIEVVSDTRVEQSRTAAEAGGAKPAETVVATAATANEERSVREFMRST
jgi:hypothetical protein